MDSTADRPPHSADPGKQLSSVDGLAQLSFLTLSLLERRAGDHGISVTQTQLLGVLRDRTPTMNELATLLGLDKSSATGLVDRAERRGLVRRIASSGDRRVVLVELADAGRALVDEVSGGFGADVATLLERLSASDQVSLSRLVSRLLVAHADANGVDLFPVA
jgi:MarR family transcriptional regulator, lower aerobic nicotinate degradation pathway regulator